MLARAGKCQYESLRGDRLSAVFFRRSLLLDFSLPYNFVWDSHRESPWKKAENAIWKADPQSLQVSMGFWQFLHVDLRGIDAVYRSTVDSITLSTFAVTK